MPIFPPTSARRPFAVTICPISAVVVDFPGAADANVCDAVKEFDIGGVIIVIDLLEESTLNEFIRNSLSEKKQIKELFLGVIKVLDVHQNSKILVSLISFGTNLCYGGN